MAKSKEKIMEIVFLLAACVSILAVALICVFLFANGIPAMGKIGPLKFLLGTTWKPSNEIFGILPMIVASIMLQQELFFWVYRSHYLLLCLWHAIVQKKSTDL
mgnify:CR=1 FL=1